MELELELELELEWEWEWESRGGGLGKFWYLLAGRQAWIAYQVEGLVNEQV